MTNYVFCTELALTFWKALSDNKFLISDSEFLKIHRNGFLLEDMIVAVSDS